MSSRSIKPQTSPDATLARSRSNASTTASARRHHFALLTLDEEEIYRYWRRATLVFYGIFLCGTAAIAIALGPADKSGGAKQDDVYSALASAVQRRSR